MVVVWKKERHARPSPRRGRVAWTAVTWTQSGMLLSGEGRQLPGTAPKSAREAGERRGKRASPDVSSIIPCHLPFLDKSPHSRNSPCLPPIPSLHFAQQQRFFPSCINRAVPAPSRLSSPPAQIVALHCISLHSPAVSHDSDGSTRAIFSNTPDPELSGGLCGLVTRRAGRIYCAGTHKFRPEVTQKKPLWWLA